MITVAIAAEMHAVILAEYGLFDAFNHFNFTTSTPILEPDSGTQAYYLTLETQHQQLLYSLIRQTLAALEWGLVCWQNSSCVHTKILAGPIRLVNCYVMSSSIGTSTQKIEFHRVSTDWATTWQSSHYT